MGKKTKNAKLQLKRILKEFEKDWQDTPFPTGQDPRFDPMSKNMGYRTAMNPPPPQQQAPMRQQSANDIPGTMEYIPQSERETLPPRNPYPEMGESKQYPSGDPEYPDVETEASKYPSSRERKYPEGNKLTEKSKYPAKGKTFPEELTLEGIFSEDFGGAETEKAVPDRRGLGLGGNRADRGRREGDLSTLIQKTQMAASVADKLMKSGETEQAKALLSRLHQLLMKKLG